MGTETQTPAPALSWGKSLLWLSLAVGCFHFAYTRVDHPVAGLFIFGYALGLVQLANQPTVRRAFYFGLATAFLCYAPQLWFFFKIFNLAAVVLWLVLAFWVGLFTAIICGAARRWGRTKAAWLVPFVWTGIEYFRSELYYLKFSWLNVGYALPASFSGDLNTRLFQIGMYGAGFLAFSLAAMYFASRWWVATIRIVLVAIILALFFTLFPGIGISKHRPVPGPTVVGIQMEFPPENIIPKMLDKALAKNTNAEIFVLSEYTLRGPVPVSLKNWCRIHSRYLVVGGEDSAGATNYYDTAFVLGTNGDIVFKQGKSVPIQFFHDGLPAPCQKVWDSPWGKIGFCICYDLSYTRVTDELIRQGAQMIIVPTMDIEYWGRHQHELHTRVAPVRAAEYGVSIFRLASSGISQAVSSDGTVIAQAPMPGNGDFLVASLPLSSRGSLPLDRYLAPVCTVLTGLVTVALLVLAWKERERRTTKQPKGGNLQADLV